MKNQILPSLKLSFISLIVFVGLYALLTWGIALVVGPNNGKVLFVAKNGTVVGADNIGQKFTSDKYFWGRPSAVDYNAAGSAGSNKAPSNADYLLVVQSRIDSFLVHNPEISKAEIPSDLVCASGSGLDPHISVQGAKVQIKRIAKTRSLTTKSLEILVDKFTEKPLLGFLGPENVNVLKLNIALDNLSELN